MATKKQLRNRWLEEPARGIHERIRKLIRDYGDVTRELASKAHAITGLFRVPKEQLPPFDTQAIFDLLVELPLRSEVANGRDLRGISWFRGHDYWDLANTDFSYSTGAEGGYTFFECCLDGAKFDESQGQFSFYRGVLRNIRFRKVRVKNGRLSSGFVAGHCVECDFTESRMKKAHFLEKSDLRGSTFAGADLSWALLTGCDLRGCDFRGATLSNAYIHESIIDKTTDFRGANLVELQWESRYSNAGVLFKHGSDWRQGTFDSTTMHD